MSNPGKTWWGARFLDALADFTDPARLQRGRAYAGDSRILAFDIAADGEVTATIRGNVNPYYGITREPRYRTRIRMTPIPEAGWNRVSARLGSSAALVCRLLMNEMPDDIDRILAGLGIALLPRDIQDFHHTECSCPDYANPCKHIAGLYYRLAAQLDQDPLLLFELRGLPRARLHRALSATPLGQALAPLLETADQTPVPADTLFTRPRLAETPPTDAGVDADTFWRGRAPLPADPEPAAAAPTAVAAILVKKGGDFPPFWERETSFLATMEEFQQRARTRNRALS